MLPFEDTYQLAVIQEGIDEAADALSCIQERDEELAQLCANWRFILDMLAKGE